MPPEACNVSEAASSYIGFVEPAAGEEHHKGYVPVDPKRRALMHAAFAPNAEVTGGREHFCSP